MLRARRPVASARSALKEAVKVALGRLGHPRWLLYGRNRVLSPCRLRDGQPAWEFLRTNPSWGGPGASDTAEGLAEVLTPRMLGRLVEQQGVAVVYTHLGKVRDPQRPFGPATQDALRHLAGLSEQRQLFVTSTRRLLRYLAVRDHLRLRTAVEGDRVVVTLECVDDPVRGPRALSDGDLDGITIGVETSRPVHVRRADGGPVAMPPVRGGDGTLWLAHPWPPLRFPSLECSD